MKTGESAFLRRMFSSLDDAAIRYAVLRNAETLPDSLDGSDIDMLVAQGSLYATAQCLVTSAEVCGGSLLGSFSYPHFRQMILLGCHENCWWGCCIDLFEGVFCQGVLPLADDGLLGKRIKTEKGIWTLDRERGHYLGFVKEFITNNLLSTRYFDGANAAMQLGKDDFLPSNAVRRFTRKVLAGERHSAKTFRLTWLLSFVMRHPLHFCKDRGGMMMARLKHLLCPAGRMIAVMGTDGSGKTTLLNAISPVLNNMTHGKLVIHHLKPDLIPPLGRLRGVKYEKDHICATPHASRPSGFIGSLVRISYLMCDYILGYWLKVRIRLAKTPITYWIFDRYAYDILIDSRRFRIRLPHWIIKAYLFFVPRPDLILCLGGDPDKIFARKSETSLDEVKRQVAALKKFCEDNKRAVWIDTTKSIDESADAALTAILEHMARRSES